MEEPLTVAAIFRDPFNILAISEVLKVVAAVGWSVNYIGMVHRAWKDQIPSIGILPLCCDIGWEFVYAWMFPDFSSHWQGVVRVWFFLHSAVLLVTLKVSPNDWANTPLAHRHIVFIYIFVTIVFGAGQYALAAEIGPALGFHWGGALCQFLSSSGGIAQLLSRGHTRGASYLIWFARAISTFAGFIKLCIRFQHNVDGAPWLDSPMCWFYIVTVLSFDTAYPFLYFSMRKFETPAPQREARIKNQ
ncbi:hypothetical protein PEBR_19794 [Penicillium brasilianum]|uniref:Uncharacterized protein n=1 Tax=Penicillium brasilianum TaxID=104259 RepID=A0A1S9RMW3_PENBI|nr:hypothetical protein PEBR_19794 [Penicillium brasilianum]